MKTIKFIAKDCLNNPKVVTTRVSSVVLDFGTYECISISEFMYLLETYSCSYIESHPVAFARLFSLYTYCRASGITFIDIELK